MRLKRWNSAIKIAFQYFSYEYQYSEILEASGKPNLLDIMYSVPTMQKTYSVSITKTYDLMLLGRSKNVFEKSRSHLKILGARRVTKFHTENPQALGATVHNVIATAIWCQKFVCNC